MVGEVEEIELPPEPAMVAAARLVEQAQVLVQVLLV